MVYALSDQTTFLGLSFGEMVDEHWQSTQDSSGNWQLASWQTKWRAGVYSLTPGALAFFAPFIDNLLVMSCYDLHPGDERLEHFSRNLSRAIIYAVNKYGPILQTLFIGDVMQDGSEGTPGAINIQDNGQSGYREAQLNTDFPQSMLLNNVQDYGSSGLSKSYGTSDYQGNLDAVLEALGADGDPQYADAVDLIIDSVLASGVFSALAY